MSTDRNTLDPINPITLEVIGADLAYVVREMRENLLRTAYSPVLTESHDFFVGITSRDGEPVAIGVDLPFHMFACRDAVAAVKETYGDDINPGDQFWLNDPWQAGSHLNDCTLLTPYFHKDDLCLWLACGAHYGDIGGTVPGSASGECTEIFHEGIRVPVVRVFDRGVRNDEFLRVLLANLRQPFEADGVFAAQSNTTILAGSRLNELFARYGTETIERCGEIILASAERNVREQIAGLPDGEYFAEDYLENGGVKWADPVYVCCKMTIAGDQLTFDFTGSSEQIDGVANCAYTNTAGAVFDVVDTYLSGARMLVSSMGAARTFSVIAPERTVVNCTFPVPLNGFPTVMWGPVHGCVQGCLSQVIPDQVSALSTSSSNQTNVAGTVGAVREDAYWILYEFPTGGWGATKDNDGSGLGVFQWHMGDIPVVYPIERIEQLNPVRGTFDEIYVDSGGPGYRRGGLGIRRSWEVTAPGQFAVMGTDGVLPRPGMCGGYAGAQNWIGLVRDGEPLPDAIPGMPLKAGGVPFQAGDIVLFLVAGGGGYGDPLDRPAEWVLRDLNDNYVSVPGARADYGVVIDDGRVDAAATEELRRQMRDERSYLTIAAADTDEYDEKRRRIIRLSPEFAARMSLADEDVVEYVNHTAMHVRAWVKVDDSLVGDAAPLGPVGRRMCRVEVGDRVHLRTPWTYCMRRRDDDMRIELPAGQLFTNWH